MANPSALETIEALITLAEHLRYVIRTHVPQPTMTYDTIEYAFDLWCKTLTIVDKPASFDSFSQGYVAGWNAKESMIEECAKIAEGHAGPEDAELTMLRDEGYNEACRDIAKAIRDAHGAKK